MGEERPSSHATPDSFEALLRRGGVPSSVRQITPLARGARLVAGRFEIGRVVGRGGMGVVYEAHDAERNEKVALKTLLELDAASVYRFKHEFRGLADVAHPNVVRLHELFAEGSLWFFTMDLVDGVPLDAYVRPDDRLDETRLRAVALQVVAAITAIHAAGKLHRDLKPSNVLVTADGQATVLDFGLVVDPEPGGVGQTLAEQCVIGTPAYMAPEQAAGAYATQASDYYALGVMMFEALTGTLPFAGHAGEMLAAKQTREAPDVRALKPEAAPDLVSLCARLLAREPAARPAPNELLERLRSAGSMPLEASERLAPLHHAADELLGRESELSQLREAYAQTRDGSPIVMFISGESGLGKSTLVEAFLKVRRARGDAIVLAGRCYERENVPYKGFDALMDNLSRHLRQLSGEEAASVLPREVYALARIFPVLERISVVAAAPKKHVPDPQDLKRRAFEAFGELLGRLRDRAPVVMLLDDAQWLDRDSVHFMRELLMHPEPTPILLLCAYRSEAADSNVLLQAVRRSAHDNAKLQVHELHVGPLPHAALRDLAVRLLPETFGSAVADALADEAQGSPFFAAEVARAVAVCGLTTRLPSLGEALNMHIARLSASAQRLLSLMAVAGEPLTADVAIDAAGINDGHLALDLLRSEQLVRVSFDTDGVRAVECYHDKIREQVTAMMDPLRVRELALALAVSLESRTEASAELLARMFSLAEQHALAAVHAARAAEAANAALAFERAAGLFAQALEHGRFNAERVYVLRIGHANALAYAGRGRSAANVYLQAAEKAPPADVDELELKAGQQLLLYGELEAGRVLLHRALRRVGHTLPRNVPLAFAAVVWSRTRLRLRGLSFTPRAQHPPETLRELERLSTAVQCLMRSDQLRAADFSARFTIRALDAGHSVMAARALGWEVLLRSMMGAPPAHVQAATALCTELCEQTQDQQGLIRLLQCRGVGALLQGGRVDDALADFDRALALLAVAPLFTAVPDRAWGHYFRAQCLAMMGRVAEAGRLAGAQLEDALVRGDHTVAIPLMQVYCWGLIAQGRTQQAERVAAEALAGIRPGEVAMQSMMAVGASLTVGVYAGRAKEAWRDTRADRERYLASWQGSSMMGDSARLLFAGTAATAALSTCDGDEHTALTREARHLAGTASHKGGGIHSVPREALLACLDGDTKGAIAALRRSIPSPHGPLTTQVLCRRLGELLANGEGAVLLAEADAFLREGGVVHPARFTAAFVPGIELRTRKQRHSRL